MAKLDNVKAVNENTVEYNGFVYTVVKRETQENDLIKFGESELGITPGAFYIVDEIDSDDDVNFIDDDDDYRYFPNRSDSYRTYRKSHPITNDKLTDAEGVVIITLPDGTKLEGTPSDLASVTRSMQVLQNEQQGQVEQVASVGMTEEAVEEGQSAPLQLQAGDYGKVVEKYDMFLPGDIVKVLRNDGSRVPYYAKRLSGGEEKWLLEKQLVRATEAEVKAVTEPKVETLKVGDYAKVVGSSHSNYFGGKDGDIVKIVKESDGTFETQELNGGIYGCNQYALKSALVKATDAEVLEAKQALLKEGDFARVISNEATTEAYGPHKFEVGTVLELHKFDSDDNTFETRHLNGDEPDAPWVHRKDLELLTKEEAEHIAREAEEEKKAKAEREEKEAVRLKWAAIGREVGEINDGDVVRVIDKDNTRLNVGDIGVVAESYDYVKEREDKQEDSVAFRVNTSNCEYVNWLDVANVELIVPVEQRFDTVG